MLNLREIISTIEMAHTLVDNRVYPSWSTYSGSPQTTNHFIDAQKDNTIQISNLYF